MNDRNNDPAIEVLILRYVAGQCTPAEQAQVERDPNLRQRAAALRQRMNDLEQYGAAHAGKPSSAEIVAFVDGTLPEPRQSQIAFQAVHDPKIRAEIEFVRGLGAVPPNVVPPQPVQPAPTSQRAGVIGRVASWRARMQDTRTNKAVDVLAGVLWLVALFLVGLRLLALLLPGGKQLIPSLGEMLTQLTSFLHDFLTQPALGDLLTQPMLYVVAFVTIIAVIEVQRRFSISFRMQPALTLSPVGGPSLVVDPYQAVSSTPPEHAVGAGQRAPKRPVARPRPQGKWVNVLIALAVLLLGMGVPVKRIEDNPPSVGNAAALQQQFAQQDLTITYYGDSVGLGHQLDVTLAGRFTRDTGIKVKVIPKPQSATDTYAYYQELFKEQQGDVFLLDIIMTDAFATHLYDLGPAFGRQERLSAVPWFDDFGMLYYRKDLVDKYNGGKVPETWDELQAVAAEIQAGERDTGNRDFWGFVFQGAPYEGLTCNVLEWIQGAQGDDAIRALNQAQSWIGTIAPQAVTTYKEEDTHKAFQSGNAAFMRNWPYAYTLLQNPKNSSVVGKFDVAPLPHSPSRTMRGGVVGGQQLGVAQYATPQHKVASTEFVRYMTSPDVQRWRAVVGSYVPAMRDLQHDPEVLQAMPFLNKFQTIKRITRPSATLGEGYNQASTHFFLGATQILFGTDAKQVYPQMEPYLK